MGKIFAISDTLSIPTCARQNGEIFGKQNAKKIVTFFGTKCVWTYAVTGFSSESTTPSASASNGL